MSTLRFIKYWLVVLVIFASALTSYSQEATKFYKGNNYVESSLVSSLKSLQPAANPEDPVAQIGVHFKIEKDWHIYWKDSGEAAIPTKIIWELPKDWSASEIYWPMPYHFIERGDIHTYGYKDEILLFADLYAPPVEPGSKENLLLKARVQFLVCNDICIPGEKTLTKEITYSFTEPLEPSENFELFKKYKSKVPENAFSHTVEQVLESAEIIDKSKEKDNESQGLINQISNTANPSFLLALISAFFAGMILNLMPCVLPIISIKVMSFLGNSEKTNRAALASSLAFAAGIVASFLSLATVVLVLKSLGTELGWGFQFQFPEFVLSLCLIVFVLALGFFELYTLSIDAGTVSKKVDALKHPLLKNFFEGILTTALATPCTAPFLGTALAFAFTQDAFSLIAIFLAISLGLSTPYVYLASHPKVLAKLPKPGPWMNSLKQLMGFFLLLTVVWLLFVLNQLTGQGGIYCLILLLLIAFSFWLKQRLKNANKTLVNTFLLVLILFTTNYLWPELTSLKKVGDSSFKTKLIDWQPFSEENLLNAKASKRTVFIDFTADWCITCKANEKLVIESEDVAKVIKENNVLPLKADWTTGNKEVTQALKRYGGTGVPHYVVIGKDGSTQVLSTLLSKNMLINALGRN